MELINFEGLNCYYNRIVSIAGSRGVDYTSSLSTLWSERKFKYDIFRKAFLTKKYLKI